MKVLIIDDDLASLSSFLEPLIKEYTIEYKFFKENPLDTLTYIKENDVDGAFISLDLFSMSGVVLAERLWEIRKDLKLVFIGNHQDFQCREELKKNVLGVCSKPLIASQIEGFLKCMQLQEKKKIIIHTFGTFDVFINQQIIQFKSAKSKELLALLITYNGKSLTMSDAICHLWPDKNLELAKRLYRDAVWKLRKTMLLYGISYIIDFKRAQLFLHKENIACDYWEYLLQPSTDYNGVFLPSYDWSIEFQLELDTIKWKRKYRLKS
ncbi:MAG: hypothetical protein NC310_04120 [Roseburia sp.]|nr:hypothetical protein [Anaeroplasma bactoclasticum]MCM1196246.1 hypothetical protein [Roseburia sp.]MCM1557154.1 hypothetical protein [Anaeroplasma bactoclasticum]